MSETFLLFADPSFIEGAARNIDLGYTLDEYNGSSTESEADYIAIKNDWIAIGKDYLDVIKKHDNLLNGKTSKAKERK